MNINSHRGTCLCCLKAVEGSLRCSKCRTALYCGRACQLKHWPVHKNCCHDSNDTENSNEKLSTRILNKIDKGNCTVYIINKCYHY